MLHYRSLILGVPAPRYWDMGEEDREFKFNNYISRYHSRHTDLMDLLAKYNGRANAPLDELAKLCGFPGKLGMDGSKVWEAWSQGRADEVRAYCETDVVNTWLVYALSLPARRTRSRLLRGRDRPGARHAVRQRRSALEGIPGRLEGVGPPRSAARFPSRGAATDRQSRIRAASIGMIGIWGVPRAS